MFARIFKSLAAWHRRNVDLHHLRELSDRSLADIGLSRSDIEAAIDGKMNVSAGTSGPAVVYCPFTSGMPTTAGIGGGGNGKSTYFVNFDGNGEVKRAA